MTKPPEERRENVLRIRLSEAERELLDKVSGGKTSTWARWHLLELAKREAKKKNP